VPGRAKGSRNGNHRESNEESEHFRKFSELLLAEFVLQFGL
jgi:hypothetical protein